MIRTTLEASAQQASRHGPSQYSRISSSYIPLTFPYDFLGNRRENCFLNNSYVFWITFLFCERYTILLYNILLCYYQSSDGEHNKWLSFLMPQATWIYFLSMAFFACFYFFLNVFCFYFRVWLILEIILLGACMFCLLLFIILNVRSYIFLFLYDSCQQVWW